MEKNSKSKKARMSNKKATEFKTIKSKEIQYGRSGFLEVARKQVKGNGGIEFIQISKGFYTNAGDRRYKNGVALPTEVKLDDVIKTIKSL
jgi:hypothetical protein